MMHRVDTLRSYERIRSRVGSPSTLDTKALSVSISVASLIVLLLLAAASSLYVQSSIETANAQPQSIATRADPILSSRRNAFADYRHHSIAQSKSIPQITPTGTCIPSWQAVTSPNFGQDTNYLQGVSAISANDIWAVGTNDYGGTYPGCATLTLHWDGQAWTRIPSPNVGTFYDCSALLGVDAVSSNEVWAVGYVDTTAPGTLTLIEHWDGVQWSIVPSPSLSNTDNVLESVTAISSNDVWAVGYFTAVSGTTGYPQTLALHWNGTQWSTIPTPNSPSDHDRFWAVSAISSNDVWAVGATAQNANGALIEHWNGSQWSIVPSPIPPCTDCGYILYGVAAISSNDVWAAGTVVYFGGGEYTLIEHWDGSQWSIIGSPNTSSTHNELAAISAVSPTDVWAVGYSGMGVLIEHWDGSQWNLIPSPNSGYLWGVVALSSTDVWAVGYLHSCQGGPCGWHTLAEHYSSPCGSGTLTPTPTPSPSPSPTMTPILTITTTPTVPPILVGHVNWEARPAQPNALQQLPITLTLRSGTNEIDYPTQLTDQYGFFTVTLGSLPNGTYIWRVDDGASGSHSPNYLANSGFVDISVNPSTNVEMGMMRTGDADDNNRVNISDFNMLKVSFGSTCGNPTYDMRTDFSGDCFINVSDFNPLKRNFGQAGALPVGPR